jgi:hypothetical protein
MDGLALPFQKSLNRKDPCGSKRDGVKTEETTEYTNPHELQRSIHVDLPDLYHLWLQTHF